jgi:membrane-associated phospholipid phosphatase
MNKIIEKSFNKIGELGPLILNLFSIYHLWNKKSLLFYYIEGAFFNKLLNAILKYLIKEPRPSEDVKKFNLAMENGENFGFKNYLTYDIYGMPSGHEQSCLYSTSFIYLSLKDPILLYIYSILSIITGSQRIKYNFHTGKQVIIGGIVGTLFGSSMYYFANDMIKGKIREKKDDDAPI